MGKTAAVVTPRAAEVPMVEQEVVRRIRVLAQAGWGHKRIAREVGVARNRERPGGDAEVVPILLTA